MRHKLEDEIKRFNKFQNIVIGDAKKQTKQKEVNIRTYAKYLLKEGSITEKRELLANLRSRLVYMDKKISLIACELSYIYAKCIYTLLGEICQNYYE